MAYSKPKTLAKSAKKLSFVAGCPQNTPHGGTSTRKGTCASCEVSR